jgi:hypothetical protein
VYGMEEEMERDRATIQAKEEIEIIYKVNW